MVKDSSESKRYLWNAGKSVMLLQKPANEYQPNTASGRGRLSFARLEYIPVLGERKSGIPAAVLIPAPVLDVVSSNGWAMQ